MMDAWRFAVTVAKRLEKRTEVVLSVGKHNVLCKTKPRVPLLIQVPRVLPKFRSCP